MITKPGEIKMECVSSQNGRANFKEADVPKGKPAVTINDVVGEFVYGKFYSATVTVVPFKE